MTSQTYASGHHRSDLWTHRAMTTNEGFPDGPAPSAVDLGRIQQARMSAASGARFVLAVPVLPPLGRASERLPQQTSVWLRMAPRVTPQARNPSTSGKSPAPTRLDWEAL